MNPGRPHGLAYSLTLHDRAGRRVFGIDNAHPVRPVKGPADKKRVSDHLHRGYRIRPYEFVDAATLLTDFWTGVAEVKRDGVPQ